MSSPQLQLTRRGLLAGLGLVGLGGCTGGQGRGVNREVVAFAAASLTDVFRALADDFQAAHRGVPTKFNFAGSQSLRTQVENGARPQVFASASDKHMEALAEAGLVEEPEVFAHNELVLVTPPDNPAKLTSLADLPRAERIVLAGEAVPAGAYAVQMLASASRDLGADFAQRVQAHVVSRENHVRQTLQKVVLGEADAAIVYATDAKSAGSSVHTVPLPAEHNVRAAYPIAVLRDAAHMRLARAFVAHVRSDAGAARLKAAGFSPA